MTAPLSDPVLEAAAHIYRSPSGSLMSLRDARKWATMAPAKAHRLIEEAARQIDALRAAGVIPKGNIL